MYSLNRIFLQSFATRLNKGAFDTMGKYCTLSGENSLPIYTLVAKQANSNTSPDPHTKTEQKYLDSQALPLPLPAISNGANRRIHDKCW